MKTKRDIKIWLMSAAFILVLIFGASLLIGYRISADEASDATYDACTAVPDPVDGSTDSGHETIAEEDEKQGEVAGEETPAPDTDSSSEGFGVGAEIPGHKGNFSGYSDWIAAFYDFSVKLGGILTVLMLIYAGYRYMTSQGNPTAINEAKDILIGSLSGYALLLLVALVLNILRLRG